MVSSKHGMPPALTILMPCCCMLLLLIICSPRICLVGMVRCLRAVVCLWLEKYRLLFHTRCLQLNTGLQPVIISQVTFLSQTGMLSCVTPAGQENSQEAEQEALVHSPGNFL